LPVLLVACSKSSSSSSTNNSTTGTLTATIDGTPVNFTVYPTALHEMTGSTYSVSFSGYSGPIGTSNYLEIGVIDEPALRQSLL
jgi:hypothetical protein